MLYIAALWRSLDILELCTHPILVQKDKIELIRSFYTQLLGSDCFSDITFFVNITLFGNDDINRVMSPLSKCV